MTMERPAVWLVAGSQSLYGDKALKEVEDNCRLVGETLSALGLPLAIIFKGVIKNSDEAIKLSRMANAEPSCLGVMAWLHTFSPAKIWTTALKLLEKPLLELHTQLNARIPFGEIDMDYMNLHQTAHGGREFGFMAARLRRPVTVAVGHYSEERVRRRLEAWMRVCKGVCEARTLKIARFGDNMRGVAVTEGDKLEAQIRFGFEVDAYSAGDLAAAASGVSDSDAQKLAKEYEGLYELSPAAREGGQGRQSVLEAARLEIAIERFLARRGYQAFTTNFESLEGLHQLPGLAAQRLMAKGIGFAAEGDWKTSAMVRILKAMGEGAGLGASFMEDYTYDFSPGGDLVLGAHMLEVCPSIAASKPLLEVKPLSIGGKSDPARLIFSASPGKGLIVSVVNVGGRFRLIANEVEVVPDPAPMPKLPVARAFWAPKPDLEISAECWIAAGGGHHSVLTMALDSWHLRSLAEELGIECLIIGEGSRPDLVRRDLRLGDAAYRF
jgi:L-arabinose isomerase